MQTSPLSAAEVEWIGTQLEIAAALAHAYTGESETPPRLERLDATWLAWHHDANESRLDPNTVINALGIAFGKHLADALELEWVIATDDYGTDLAVFGQPGAVTFYPANMIAKRLESREAIFKPLHTAAVASVRQLRSKF